METTKNLNVTLVTVETPFNPRSEFDWGRGDASYMAVAFAEGFEEASDVDTVIEAWAYLIHTGMAWNLQGFFGRQASSLIEREAIGRDGQVNWELIDELK